MFDRDIRHYAPTPRSLQTSKFGPYSTMTPTPPRTPRWLIAALAVSAISVMFFAAALLMEVLK